MGMTSHLEDEKRWSSCNKIRKDLEELTDALGKATLNSDTTKVIDTKPGISELLESLVDLPVKPPSLYLDLEGVNLSREGTISILQIYVAPRRIAYLIDIHVLQAAAFTQQAKNGQTLKAILESGSIPKVFFDVRNDSDALYSHFGIKLAGVQDLQLMELATRSFSRKRVNGLARCIENDAILTPSDRDQFRRTKEKGLDLFAPERGGTYEVFNIRPLATDIINYCVQDVHLLPQLWRVYDQRLTIQWRKRVEEETLKRVEQSQSKTYRPNGMHKALAPQGWASL